MSVARGELVPESRSVTKTIPTARHNDPSRHAAYFPERLSGQRLTGLGSAIPLSRSRQNSLVGRAGADAVRAALSPAPPSVARAAPTAARRRGAPPS